jgi:hypothetical protein
MIVARKWQYLSLSGRDHGAAQPTPDTKSAQEAEH